MTVLALGPDRRESLSLDPDHGLPFSDQCFRGTVWQVKMTTDVSNSLKGIKE